MQLILKILLSKITSVIILCICVCSCASSQQNEHKIIDSYFKSAGRLAAFNREFPHLKLSANDTIIIIDQPIPKDRMGDALYWPEKFNVDKGHIAPIWIDSTKAFVLKPTDRDFMKKAITTGSKLMKWDPRKLKTSNIIVTPADSVFSIYSGFGEIKSGKRFIVYELSDPIFNQDKNIAAFYRVISLNSPDSALKWDTVIMRKEKDEWIYIGEVHNTFETGY